MKAKLKFDKQALVGFFAGHVEKIVLALGVIFFLLLAYQALALPTYTKTPEQLASEAESAMQHIQSTEVKPEVVGVKAADYPGVAARSRNLIEEKFYAHNAVWNPPLFRHRRPRTEPQLYTVQDLRVHSDFGQFSIRAGGEGTALRGQRWVVITGLVPLAEQRAAYLEAFRDHLKPDTDAPQYIYYRVERAEVDRTTDEENLAWTPINLRQAMTATEKWERSEQEVAATAYLHEKTVFPLGPLVGRTWDAMVAHPPEVPLGGEAEAAAAEPQNQAKPATALPDMPQDLPDLPAKPKPDQPAPTGPAKAIPEAKPPVAEGEGPSEEVPHYLFRFFDFEVQAGKAYRYRVRLMLANPNQGWEARYLQRADLATKQWLETPWSDPTPTVAIPPDDRLLVSTVHPGRRPEDARVTFGLKKWVHTEGVSLKAWKEAGRGQVLDFDTVDMTAEVSDPPKRGGPRPKSKPEVRSEDGGPKAQPFKTGAVVLDMRGGESLDKFRRDKSTVDVVDPAEVLLLNSDGSLLVSSYVDNKTELDTFGKAPEASDTADSATDAGGAPDEGGGLMDLAKPKKPR